MKKLLVSVMSMVTLFCSSYGQTVYEPSWESMNKRECPAWFEDAKFGVFICMGLYSVPSYMQKGAYAEWYWNNLEGERKKSGISPVEAFHNKNYGEDFDYPQFADMFKCELFDADEWANFIERSGARYVVFTAKYHDGFCLWDSKEATESYGMPWNSVDIGPKRDLVGELTTAVRKKKDVKMGLYYSIWDWYNPYWTADMQKCVSEGNMDVDFTKEAEKVDGITPELVKESKAGLSKYIHKVMYPQFKEMVNKYQPSIIFSDGDWFMNSKLWETETLISWLYNNAPNKEEVVVNDRWGKGRGTHGDYYTTEFGAGFEDIDRPWEENRGMGRSFGLNRIENYDDYNSDKELIFMLADLVSRGGNLLLNIGPNADGTIPVIMQERLVHIGNWLKVNGDAIYGTRKYKHSAQWSLEGEKPVSSFKNYNQAFPIFELTLNPKPGNSYKELWFTQKGNKLYALSPEWPREDKVVVRDVDIDGDVNVRLLGCDKKLPFKVKGKNIIIDISDISVRDLSCDYVYSFEITGVKE